MYHTILIATDGSEPADEALRHAAVLAQQLNSKLVIVTVTAPHPTFDPAEIGWSLPANIYSELTKGNAAKAKSILAAARAIAARHVSEIETIHVAEYEPFEGIIDTANQTGANVIVIAPHSKSILDRLMLGSQTSRVLSQANIPVLVVKQMPGHG